jgi:uracil-DNA glycosylase family 4
LEWQELNQRVMACRLCPRLVSYREETARVKKRAFRDWDYWGKPVPGFGDPQARLLVVGLAPGAHGSNRTGRMFTGDSSGDFLYAALYRAGMANQPTPISREDGLMLRDIYITAICRCVPPDNKPTPTEIRNCQPFLEAELALLHQVQGIVALGSLGFQQVLTIFRGHGHTLPKMEFGHNRLFHPGDNLPWLLASYHPSRQNTQTGRLTREMFDQLWIRAQALLV